MAGKLPFSNACSTVDLRGSDTGACYGEISSAGIESVPTGQVARAGSTVTYSPTRIVLAAIVYFLLLWPLVRPLSRLENRALAGRR